MGEHDQFNAARSALSVAALAIDKVGPRPTIFVRVLPRALPLGQEAKKVKSPWSSLAVLKGHSECLKCGRTL